jgi:hypothetical protein
MMGAMSSQAMRTRFRPADPDGVRRRFEQIRERAVERVDEERRSTLERLRRGPPERSERRPRVRD